MSDVIDALLAHELLTALGEQLAAARHAYELVVIGGSGLLALGILDRATHDVDVLALRTRGSLVKAEPLPAALVTARDRVSRDFDVPTTWLNAGPSGLIDLGLPQGFEDRLTARRYGDALTVHLASRLDQIHFKLYALVDQGPGKHESDLRAMAPTSDELTRAARWTRTHDPSPGFNDMLTRALRHLGVDDAELDA